MNRKIIYILIFFSIFLFSCKPKKTFDIEKEFDWSFIEKSTKISKKKILKNYKNQIKILKKKNKIKLFGDIYKKVKKVKVNERKSPQNILDSLYRSSINFSYYKYNDGIYFEKDKDYKKIKQIYYKFYKFNPQNYIFEYMNKKIKVPHNGPGSMGASYSGATTHYIDDKYFWYCSFDTKQFHWWDFDNKYIDTFNMNVDNKFFYIARNFLMLPNYKKNDLLITPNFVIGNHLKANKWWLKKPLLYKIDMYDSTYSKIDIDFQIKDEHNYIACIDNGYADDETMILMGTEPIILFLGNDYEIIKKLDLRNTYKKYNLEHLYENYELVQPWGKVFNVSNKYLLIMTPLFHFSDYNKVSLTGINNSKEKYKRIKKITDTEEVGRRKNVKKRLAILVNKKTKNVEKSDIVELPVYSHDFYFMGPFLEVDYFVLKEMKFVIVNLSYTKQLQRVEDYKDRKWHNYYYVYKRQKEK